MEQLTAFRGGGQLRAALPSARSVGQQAATAELSLFAPAAPSDKTEDFLLLLGV
jgi:hypothetical protein